MRRGRAKGGAPRSSHLRVCSRRHAALSSAGSTTILYQLARRLLLLSSSSTAVPALAAALAAGAQRRGPRARGAQPRARLRGAPHDAPRGGRRAPAAGISAAPAAPPSCITTCITPSFTTSFTPATFSVTTSSAPALLRQTYCDPLAIPPRKSMRGERAADGGAFRFALILVFAYYVWCLIAFIGWLLAFGYRWDSSIVNVPENVRNFLFVSLLPGCGAAYLSHRALQVRYALRDKQVRRPPPPSSPTPGPRLDAAAVASAPPLPRRVTSRARPPTSLQFVENAVRRRPPPRPPTLPLAPTPPRPLCCSQRTGLMATAAFYLYENVERYERMDCYYLALFYWLFCTQLAICLLSLLASQAPSAPLLPRTTSHDLARPCKTSPNLARPRPTSLTSLRRRSSRSSCRSSSTPSTSTPPHGATASS